MIDTTITQDMLESYTTERRNERSMDIDTKSSIDILRIINAEDKTVPFAVEKAIDHIAGLVDDVVTAFRKGGRLIYIGAGTSGRLGVLDASEVSSHLWGASHDGARTDSRRSRRSYKLHRGRRGRSRRRRTRTRTHRIRADDVLVGITASGQAPYVLGAMARARDIGAVVAAISCNHGSKTFKYAKHAIFLDVGPEVVTGSTRMKAGTAQKLVLNMITTASMIRFGKVFHNLMVDLKPVNRKLVERSKRLIRQATGCSKDEAESAFEASGRTPKIAIIMVLLKVGRAEAERLEKEGGGLIAGAIAAYKKELGQRQA